LQRIRLYAKTVSTEALVKAVRKTEKRLAATVAGIRQTLKTAGFYDAALIFLCGKGSPVWMSGRECESTV